MRAVFIARVLAMNVEGTLNGNLLNETVTEEYTTLLDILRKFDKNMLPYKEPNMKWLDKTIDRSHAFGITSIIETFAQLQTETDEELYHEVTEIFHNVIALSKRGKKINMKKYQLLLQLINNELQADTESPTKSRVSEQDGNLIFDFKISL